MKRFKTVYLYRDSDFPEKGWIHPCFLCLAPTGNLVHYKTEERIEYSKKKISNSNSLTSFTNIKNLLVPNKVRYEYIVYMCRCCNKKIPTTPELKLKFTSRCERYIRSIHR